MVLKRRPICLRIYPQTRSHFAFWKYPGGAGAEPPRGHAAKPQRNIYCRTSGCFSQWARTWLLSSGCSNVGKWPASATI